MHTYFWIFVHIKTIFLCNSISKFFLVRPLNFSFKLDIRCFKGIFTPLLDCKDIISNNWCQLFTTWNEFTCCLFHLRNHLSGTFILHLLGLESNIHHWIINCRLSFEVLHIFNLSSSLWSLYLFACPAEVCSLWDVFSVMYNPYIMIVTASLAHFCIFLFKKLTNKLLH